VGEVIAVRVDADRDHGIEVGWRRNADSQAVRRHLGRSVADNGRPEIELRAFALAGWLRVWTLT
jgi:hypothetical protein